MRIGTGFDAHRFENGRKLIVGGVEIDHPQGLGAHSDGDVLIHALCDAILGACALGDIGQHFPNDAAYEDMDSRIFLQQIHSMVVERGFKIVNVDTTLIAQKPKFAPYLLNMRENLAVDLDVNLDQISIKATTTDAMGFTGRGEGVAAQAVVLLSHDDTHRT